jgi:mono/diheme cytochrome c family protein
MKNVTRIRSLILMLEVTIFVICVSLQWAFAKESASVDDGEALFQAKCSPCHTIGGGRLVGPDLKGATALRDHAWLANFISAPDRVLASGDPIANRLLKEYGGVAMPNLGLNHSQVDELITYLAESSPRKSSLHPAGATEATVGDPQAGAKLFTGIISFQKGGAPCLACHAVSGVAPLGGGSLGPELTGIYGRLGEAGLASLLATLPFPTMRPIFQTRPLTQAERGDLTALFRVAAGRQPVDAMPRITALALSGSVLFLLLAGVIWRKRLKSVRRAFVTALTETGGDRR